MTLVTNPQAMTETIAPTIPPEPAPLPGDATPEQREAYWREWDIYLRAVGEVNRCAGIAASEKNALAQAETAAAQNRTAMAQEAIVVAMGQSVPPPVPAPSPAPAPASGDVAEVLEILHRLDRMHKGY